MTARMSYEANFRQFSIRSDPRGSGFRGATAAGAHQSETTVCYGSCPEYSLRIDSSGTVSYEGHEYVATQGIRTSSITTDQFRELVEAFAKFRFFELRNEITLALGANSQPIWPRH